MRRFFLPDRITSDYSATSNSLIRGENETSLSDKQWMDAKIFHFKCGAEGEGETEGLDSVMRNGVAGPKKLGGTHVTLKNEYEN